MEASWINGLLGGIVLGVAAVLLLLANGRIAGISGIFGALTNRRLVFDWSERSLFMIGMVAAPALYYLLAGGVPSITVTANPLLLILAGGLVGIGTQMGSGCTSGHGICGTARFSKRSIVAVATFMAFGALSVFVLRLLGLGVA